MIPRKELICCRCWHTIGTDDKVVILKDKTIHRICFKAYYAGQRREITLRRNHLDKVHRLTKDVELWLAKQWERAAMAAPTTTIPKWIRDLSIREEDTRYADSESYEQ